jgi:uncharacterized protein YPO0396
MPKSNTLSLTRIFLYNWHRFSNHVIPVTNDLYITGENGTGKSTILDALQLVLIGNATQVHFNQAAQNDRTRSTRSIGTYTLAKIDEVYLRNNNTVSYIVLEFTDDMNQDKQSVGVCIETNADRSTERTHFLLAEALNPDLYVVEGIGRDRRSLRPILKSRRSPAIFDQNEITRYQGELLNRLGGLNTLFFELLGQALTFKPIYNVHDFVAKMILQPYRIDLTPMQEAQRDLREVEHLAEVVKTQIKALQDIVEKQDKLCCLRQQHMASTILLALFQLEEIKNTLKRTENQIASRNKELLAVTTSLQTIEDNIKETEDKREAAQKRLLQNDSKQQRDTLTEAIKDGQERVREIQQRWDNLKTRMETLSSNLRIVIKSDVLADDGLKVIKSLFTAIVNPTPAAVIPEEVLSAIEQSNLILKDIHTQKQESLYELKRKIIELQAQQAPLQKIKDRLEQENAIQYPPHVERLRAYITQRLGVRPSLVCELLNIPDERWQNAVEAQLGPRRFNLVVPPEHFNRALQVLDDARARQRIYHVGLLDLERLQEDGLRPAQSGSLAEKVETREEAIRPYIDMVLGNIITCETLEDLRRHRRAITAEVMVYNEATAYAIDPQSYRPLCIGSRAKQSQLADVTRDLKDIEQQLKQLVPQEKYDSEFLRTLERISNLLLIVQPILSEPLDESPILARIAEQEKQLRALNLVEVKDLEDTIEDCKRKIREWQKEHDALIKKQGGIEKSKEKLEDDKKNSQNDFDAKSTELEQHRALTSDAFIEAEKMQSHYQKQTRKDAVVAIEDQKTKLNTEIEEKKKQLFASTLLYNTNYPPGVAQDNMEHEPFYRNERQRLEETELSTKEELIKKVRRQTEDQLRQDILHKLAEQVEKARKALGRINSILATTTFHGKSYHLIHPVNELRRGYYDIIQASASLGKDSLYESTFYQEYQETCDLFFDILLRTPRTPDEQKEQDQLVDYRNYLKYDIETTNADGRKTSLAKTLLDRSGGETQTPFYVAIAASFASLYKVGEQLRRPTIRLAIFDEAFSKMDQRYIESALEIFRRFNLQIIVATPPDRTPYLGPKMHTSLALVLQDDIVRIETLQRYLDELPEN